MPPSPFRTWKPEDLHAALMAAQQHIHETRDGQILTGYDCDIIRAAVEGAWDTIREAVLRDQPQPVPVITRGDIITINPESGPRRNMVVAHVEHHIITMAD